MTFSSNELRNCLDELALSQTEAARLLSVNLRTIHRWLKNPSEIPLATEELLRVWIRLKNFKLSWRPDEIPLGEDYSGLSEQISKFRDHAIGLSEILERVKKRNGPNILWNVDLEKKIATLGPMRVRFYHLIDNNFSISSYARSDKEPNLQADYQLLEDAVASIAKKLEEGWPD